MTEAEAESILRNPAHETLTTVVHALARARPDGIMSGLMVVQLSEEVTIPIGIHIGAVRDGEASELIQLMKAVLGGDDDDEGETFITRPAEA